MTLPLAFQQLRLSQHSLNISIVGSHSCYRAALFSMMLSSFDSDVIIRKEQTRKDGAA